VRRPESKRSGAKLLRSLGFTGLVALIVFTFGLRGRPAPPTPEDPMVLGRAVTAKTMNEYAADVGCPGLLLRDGEDTVEEVLRQIHRCVDKRELPLLPGAVR